MTQQQSGAAVIGAAATKAMCLVQCAMNCLESDPQAAWRCLSDLSTLLGAKSAASAQVTLQSPPRGGLTPWQAKRAIAYIDEHLGTRLGTSELAALLSYSPGHFAHAFKLSVGMSPTAFVTKRRVERAKLLMLSTGQRLSDIALDCGFADQPHLTHWFRRIVGVSPGLWRRSRVAAENGAAQ